MSSAYYLAKPIKASAQESAPPRKSTPPRDHTPPRKMAVTMEDMPTLSTLYNEGTIIRCDDKPLYKAAAALNDKISVIRQDITKLAVDSIVNAANTSLLGGGGVDGAIHCAAGPRLYDECETLRGCKTGSAKITDGYELPSNKVIHAVGPIYWREGKAASADLLAGCYRTSLELAVESGCKSIAFSALSTGVYGYPSGEASWVALETVRKFLEGETASKLDRVIFCNFLEKDEVAYFENIPTFFPPPEPEKEANAEQKAPVEQETATEPSEILSQLPDAPTEDPIDLEDNEEPSTKKQKTDEVDEDFVVVEKEDAVEDKPKAEL